MVVDAPPVVTAEASMQGLLDDTDCAEFVAT